MRLLDRYLLRELITPLAYCLGGFLVFYVAFDLIFGIGRFQELHLRAADVVDYYIVTLPEILVLVIPVSLLLALLYALTTHSRHNELTAIRAAGVSLARISVIYLGVGMVLGLALLAINELWAPQAADEAKEILRRGQPHAENGNWTGKFDFHNEAEGRHWIIGNFNRKTLELINPMVICDFTNGSRRSIYANEGVYRKGQWIFTNTVVLDTPPGSPLETTKSNYPTLAVTLSETPEWIKSEIKVAAMNRMEAAKKPQLSIREIRDYMRLHPHVPDAQAAVLLTQLQERIAEPFTCIAVVLIALPFGMRTGRQNVFAGVAGSIFICFAYFIMQRICMAFGVGGNLPPVLAAWLPNAVFGVTGLILMWRAR